MKVMHEKRVNIGRQWKLRIYVQKVEEEVWRYGEYGHNDVGMNKRKLE